MSQTPVLAAPDFSQEFIIESDACMYGAGAVLMQAGRPIAFYSKAFSPRNMGLSTYEKELLAVVLAVNKWRKYLLSRPFTIKTDQEAIKFLLSQKITTLMQQKWFTKLLSFDYKIMYKRERDNVVADPLSRIHEQPQLGTSAAISILVPQWKEDDRHSWHQDPEFIDILAALAVDPKAAPDFSLQEGDLRFKGCLVVGQMGDIRQQIMSNLHNGTKVVILAGRQQLTESVPFFWWPSLNKDVKIWVQQCEAYQRCKSEHLPSPGLLQPIELPSHAWSTITMDFIESLPKSAGRDTILVVIDKYTKFAHFIALQHPFSASQVAQTLLDNVFKLYGPITAIITYRDKIFTSQFWTELFKKLGTTSKLSTAYHPQTDGQSERLNQYVEMYLRCSTYQRPNQ